ncbi:MAG TPA: hypothetical protein VFU86_17260 [Terriglobales bacterium]|nr:hypothetical protein [Terriglobales bacterium]
MADSLYLSLWFPSLDAEEMLPRALTVLKQFPFSAVSPGVRYVAVHPVDWSEPTVMEQRFTPPVSPDELPAALAEFTEPDYGIALEAYWDLWSPDERGEWTLRPNRVDFLVNGVEFDDGAFRDRGHIEIEFGLDFPFLFEERDLSHADEERVKSNVAKLVDFTQKLEKNAGLRGRVLWSESEENLAQKLIARLQKVQ